MNKLKQTLEEVLKSESAFFDSESEELNYIKVKDSADRIKDEWKNLFLKEITEIYSEKKILKIEGKKYNLIGLPLFNQNSKIEFEEQYNKLIR